MEHFVYFTVLNLFAYVIIIYGRVLFCKSAFSALWFKIYSALILAIFCALIIVSITHPEVYNISF